MPLSALSAVLLLTVGGVPIVRTAPAASASTAQPASNGQLRGVSLLDLSSVRRQFNALARQLGSADEAERAAGWADLSVLAEAVAGEARVGPLVFEDPEAPSQSAYVIMTPEVTERDTVAYQLLSLGYSAHETADVASGRISKQALDTARNMLGLGVGRDVAANYLDSQYRQVLAQKNPVEVLPDEEPVVAPKRFDAVISKYASLHDVDAALVRAIIGVESAFDPRARSLAGAVGLMQLMPATARALRVDPSVPEQNIEGGVRYLSELLKMFGAVELALVAYNGGPGFARRYALGETALYGETRNYVNRVLTRARTLR